MQFVSICISLLLHACIPTYAHTQMETHIRTHSDAHTQTHTYTERAERSYICNTCRLHMEMIKCTQSVC